jgi:transposase-like protein
LENNALSARVRDFTRACSSERSEGVKRIARELGVDRKTVKRWPRLSTFDLNVKRLGRKRSEADFRLKIDCVAP